MKEQFSKLDCVEVKRVVAEMGVLTVKMLGERSIRGVFENKHSVEGLVLMAIPNHIQEILVVCFC